MFKTQILFKDGDRYQGQINSEQKLDGKGIYHFKNGSKYEGQFKNNYFNGIGQLFDKVNNLRIKCIFIKNKALGQGTINYADGSQYKGYIQDNMRHGKGQLKFGKASQYLSYVGNFKEDRFDGLGQLVYRDGSYYKGYFSNGVFDGRGEFKLLQFLYKGDFKEGIIQGNGVIVYTNKQQYQGEFKNNKKHGQGAYKYNNGQTYKGKWRNDLRHSHGKLTFPDNTYYQGEFENDEYSGTGVYFENGIKIEGQFEKSKLNGEVIIKMKQNTNFKGIFKEGMKNGFFELTKEAKGESMFYRGQFQNNVENKIYAQMSSRI